eukprot:14632523-Heterocapsa_arctica.AAC.1
MAKSTLGAHHRVLHLLRRPDPLTSLWLLTAGSCTSRSLCARAPESTTRACRNWNRHLLNGRLHYGSVHIGHTSSWAPPSAATGSARRIIASGCLV